MGLIEWLINSFKQKKQRTFCYCTKCNNELISSNSFVEDVDGIVKYQCSNCGNVTFWDFAHFPVPFLRTCAYFHHLQKDNCGGVVIVR